MKKIIGVSVLVFFAMTGVAGPLLAQDVIDRNRTSMSDTDFHRWLRDYAPETDEMKGKRFNILSRSDRVSTSRKLTYYEEWTKLRNELPRPNQQVLLALRAERSSLARQWLDQWLSAKKHAYRSYESMIDVLVDAGELEWARDVIGTAHKHMGNNRSFFRRLAAIEQALGHPEKALDQFLKAWKVYKNSRYIRLRIKTLLNNNDVDDVLLEKVKQHTRSGQKRKYMLELVEDYLIEGERIDDLSAWFSRLYSSEEQERKRATRILDRLMEKERYELAHPLSTWVKDRWSDNDVLIRHGNIETKLGHLDTAVRTLDSLDTTTLTEEMEYRRNLVKMEWFLRKGDDRSAGTLLKTIGQSKDTHEFWIEYFEITGQYEELLSYLEDNGLDKPVLKFLTRVKTGTVSDTILERLVDQKFRNPETALSLAVAGMEKPESAGEFLRWLDGFPFRSTIREFPPDPFRNGEGKLPKVLVDRWFDRFAVGETGADTLVKVGGNMKYPPLLLEAARGYRRSGRPGKAITILEEILIKYPETMLRSRIESMLNEIS